MAAVQRRVIIYGGNGALGKTVVSYFKEKNWWVASIDLSNNDQADANIAVGMTDSWEAQTEQVSTGVSSVLSDDKLDALICVAGGWAGGSASSKDFVKNCDLMWKQSVWTSTIAAQVASKHLKEGGLLALTGAKPALEATPGMIGYGMAKAAVHQLVKSLSTKAGGLPEGASALAILPVTLDTPMNRKFMPNADHSEWTSLEFVSELLFNWSNGNERPASGNLIQLITTNNKTDLVNV